MATLAERRAAARRRLAHGARRAGGFLAGRTGALIMGGGIGAAGQVVGQMAGDKIDFIKNNWYGEPLALGVGAFLLARRKPNWAHALAGAAGYSAAFRYKLNSFQQGKGSSPVPTFTQGSATPARAGFLQEAGTGAYENPVGF